jgi:2-C-methyl-D-erythritol 2,4-cyclodiphosphate synthase
MIRIGHGYDVHRLVENRKLILGGVEIPHKTGLLGHSDADVLLHAVMDAVIGALALGDIGKHFPDNSSEFKDISSMELLKSTKALMDKKGAAVVNLDATLILQKPKISDYIYQMRENISKILECGVECVNIKATTEEKLGFTGREEGVSAHAVVLLEIKK